MSSAATHPDHGARFQITLRQPSPEQATYQVDLYLPNAHHTYQATLSMADGLEQLEATQQSPQDAPAPEAWTEKHIRFLCKQLHRNARKDQTWPRRIRQWKTTRDT